VSLVSVNKLIFYMAITEMNSREITYICQEGNVPLHFQRIGISVNYCLQVLSNLFDGVFLLADSHFLGR